ncbi:MAG: dihydroorotase [Pseudomonadota bacterium]
MTDRIRITRPDDWHLHVRDGAVLKDIVPHTSARFGRAIIMPNLQPPCCTVGDARAYRQRILDAVPAHQSFEPQMVLYARDAMTPAEIHAAAESGIVRAVKLYPAGATTNSDSGVTDIRNIDKSLAAMQEVGMPLLVHGEVTDPEVDMFDREAVFIERVLLPTVERFPSLKVVFEHITTAQAAEFVRSADERIAATVTIQHLLFNRNALFQGGLRPHHFCLPVLKREHHRAALLEAVTSGHPRFFLGTDSAPHPKGKKESDCGCAGIFSAFAGIELYAEIFDQAGALDRLEAFASLNGPRFYGLPVNSDQITLERQPWRVPEHYDFGEDEQLVPLRAGGEIAWRLVENGSQA